MQKTYINTDLDIWSPQDLNKIGKYLENKCLVLQNYKQQNLFFLSLESAGEIYTINKNIAELLEVINTLPDIMKAIIIDAKCDFNIGLYSHTGKAQNETISLENLQKITTLGASVSWTIYPIT